MVHRNEFRSLCWAGELSSAWCLRGLCFFFVGKCSLFVVVSLVSENYFVIDSGFVGKRIPPHDIRFEKKEEKKNWRRKCCVWIFLGGCFLSQQSCFGFLWFNAVPVCLWCSDRVPIASFESNMKISYIFLYRLLVSAKCVKISPCKWRSLDCGKHTKHTSDHLSLRSCCWATAAAAVVVIIYHQPERYFSACGCKHTVITSNWLKHRIQALPYSKRREDL